MAEAKTSKRAKHFNQSSEGACYLIEQFRAFNDNPAAGINFTATKQEDIKKIFYSHPVFHQYSIRAFVNHFKRYAAEFQNEVDRHRVVKAISIDRAEQQKRRQEGK